MVNITVNDQSLLEKARQFSKSKKDSEIVEEALREFVERHANHPFLSLMGTVDFDEDWDYKEMRKKDLKRIPKDQE